MDDIEAQVLATHALNKEPTTNVGLHALKHMYLWHAHVTIFHACMVVVPSPPRAWTLSYFLLQSSSSQEVHVL